MTRHVPGFITVAVCMITAFSQTECEAQPARLPAEPALIQRFGGLEVNALRRSEPILQPVHPMEDEQLPGDALKITEEYDAEVGTIQLKADAEIAAIQQKAEAEKRTRREKIIKALQELQNKYTREAKLDEAVAIRNRIRRLKLADVQVYRDPGSLYGFQQSIGQSFHFEVVGNLQGSLWGTEVYTGDSSLAAAAVHSGVLRPGQKGIVKVTILEGQEDFEGSTQYDVTSSSYRHYAFSYTVEPWREVPSKPQ